MFTSPGTRDNPGGDGQLKIKNTIIVGPNVYFNANTMIFGNVQAGITNLIPQLTLQIANSVSQTVMNPLTLSIGNSIANAFSNSIQFIVQNSTSNVAVTPLALFVGNSTANVFSNSIFFQDINSTANTKSNPGTMTLAGAGSNTGLTLGTSSIAGNGYTWLPNGILMQWFCCNATSTATSFTIPIAWPTGPFAITGNSNGLNAGFGVAVVNSNTTVVALKTANTLVMNVCVLMYGH